MSPTQTDLSCSQCLNTNLRTAGPCDQESTQCWQPHPMAMWPGAKNSGMRKGPMDTHGCRGWHRAPYPPGMWFLPLLLRWGTVNLYPSLHRGHRGYYVPSSCGRLDTAHPTRARPPTVRTRTSGSFENALPIPWSCATPGFVNRPLRLSRPL